MSEPTFRAPRIFDLAKGKEFHLDSLGFRTHWEQRFEAGAPADMRIARDDPVLHLGEHHGDGRPGAVVHVRTRRLLDLHREIAARGSSFMRPRIERTPRRSRLMAVTDPFNNRLRFDQGPSQGDG